MVEHETGVTIGFDSRVSFGSSYNDLEADKVFANNGIVFGIAGAVLDSQIIRYADLPDPADAGWDIDKWVTNELIPELAHALDDRAAFERHSGKGWTNSHILAVVRDRVYQISSDTAWVRRTDGVYTIGSGSGYARGALSVKASVRQALEVAAAHDKGTGNRLRVIQAAELLGE